MHVVATAGHVDHGKSTLVLALTGMDPDRLRGGEAARPHHRPRLRLDGSCRRASGVAFVDVPGHVRFLKNMLAGVGAVDACLFVVAATEGWKPQSEEHLRILELLGVAHGVVALTKVGLVDDDYVELARLDLADHVAGTFLDVGRGRDVDAPSGHRRRRRFALALDRLLADDAARRSTAAAPACGSTAPSRPKGAGHRRDGNVDRRLARASATSCVVLHDAGTQPVRVGRLQSLKAAHDTVGPGQPRRRQPRRRSQHDDVRRGDASSGPANGIARTTFDAVARRARLARPRRVAARRVSSPTSVAASMPCTLRILGAEAIGAG